MLYGDIMLSGQFLELEQLISNGAVLRSKTVECIEVNGTNYKPTGQTGTVAFVGIDFDGVLIPLYVWPSFNIETGKGIAIPFKEQIWVKADRTPTNSDVAVASWGTKADNGILRICRIRTYTSGYVYLVNSASYAISKVDPTPLRYSDEAAIQGFVSNSSILAAAYFLRSDLYATNSCLLRKCNFNGTSVEPTSNQYSGSFYFEKSTPDGSGSYWSSGSKTQCLTIGATISEPLFAYMSGSSYMMPCMFRMCDSVKEANGSNTIFNRYVILHPSNGDNVIAKFEACHVSRIADWGYTTTQTEGYFIRLVTTAGTGLAVPSQSTITVL